MSKNTIYYYERTVFLLPINVSVSIVLRLNVRFSKNIYIIKYYINIDTLI